MWIYHILNNMNNKVLSLLIFFFLHAICFAQNNSTVDVVDLGLTVKWATCNIGASSPEEYGEYYSWGEVSPKHYYYYNTYKWCKGESMTIIKYCSYPSYGDNSFSDGETILHYSDDVAYLKYKMRIPTKAEWEELITYCTWMWSSLNGVTGYKVKSNVPGYTNKWIFIPASGYYLMGELHVSKEMGYYWSSVIGSVPDYASTLGFTMSKVHMENSLRIYGCAIRPDID